MLYNNVCTNIHRFSDAYFSHNIEAMVKILQLKRGYKVIKFLHLLPAFVSFKSKKFFFLRFLEILNKAKLSTLFEITILLSRYSNGNNRKLN